MSGPREKPGARPLVAMPRVRFRTGRHRRVHQLGVDALAGELPGDRFLMVIAWREDWAPFLDVVCRLLPSAEGVHAAAASRPAPDPGPPGAPGWVASPGMAPGWDAAAAAGPTPAADGDPRPAVPFEGDETGREEFLGARNRLVRELAAAGLIDLLDDREVRWTGASTLRFARVDRADLVDLEYVLDSNRPEFRAFAERQAIASGGVVPMPIECNLFALQPAPAAAPANRMTKARLVLELREVGPPSPCPSVIGIDFGHNATVMTLGEAFESLPVTLELEEHEGRPERRIESSVAIEWRSLRIQKPGIRPMALWTIGRSARDSAQSGLAELFQGTKRLMVNPEPKARGDSELDLLPPRDAAALPAELYLARLLRAFRERKRVGETGQLESIGEQAVRIVITYPTKFNAWEVGQLRKTFLQAFLRAMGNGRVAVPESEIRKDLSYLLFVDEAYAGGLYLVFQDYLNRRGGATALRYLFPRGMNLLSIDVGGGTTDAALLRVEPLPSAEEGLARGYVISIRVLGRSGDRKFGGDTITREIFAVLKARLAAARSAPIRDEMEKLPAGDGPALAEWLERRARKIDDQIPTRSDLPQHHNNRADLQARRDLTQRLWDAAERIKEQLSGPDSAGTFQWIPDQQVLGHLRRLIRPPANQAWEHAYAVTMTRAEVDRLVAPHWQRSVNNLNAMLGSLREEGTIPGEDIDAIYLLGNGSLYPLIPERIASDLRVRFAGDRIRRPRDPADLKDAVAKGAALLGMGLAEGVTYRFETADRLPHDVGCRNLVFGPNLHVLFREHTRMDKLTPMSVPVPAPDAENQPAVDQDVNTFLLYSRASGEAEEPFLKCVFPRPIKGPALTVGYDAQAREYVVKDSGGQVAVVHPQARKGVEYIPLSQSGKI